MQESRRWRISPTLLIKLLDSMAYIPDDNGFSNTRPLIFPAFITGRKTFCHWPSLPGKHTWGRREFVIRFGGQLHPKKKEKEVELPPSSSLSQTHQLDEPLGEGRRPRVRLLGSHSTWKCELEVSFFHQHCSSSLNEANHLSMKFDSH